MWAPVQDRDTQFRWMEGPIVNTTQIPTTTPIFSECRSAQIRLWAPLKDKTTFPRRPSQVTTTVCLSHTHIPEKKYPITTKPFQPMLNRSTRGTPFFQNPNYIVCDTFNRTQNTQGRTKNYSKPSRITQPATASLALCRTTPTLHGSLRVFPARRDRSLLLSSNQVWSIRRAMSILHSSARVQFISCLYCYKCWAHSEVHEVGGGAQTLFTQRGETRVPGFLMASCISHNCFPSGNLINTGCCCVDQKTHNTWTLCFN